MRLPLSDTIIINHSSFRGGSGITRKSHCGRRAIGMDGLVMADFTCRGTYIFGEQAEAIDRNPIAQHKIACMMKKEI